MAAQLITIFIATIVTHNIALAYLLGMCPFVALSTRLKTAFGMSIAVIFVVTLTAAVNWPIYHLILVPTHSELIYFIGVFPHERLALDVLLIDVEEHRHPRKQRRWNRSAWKTIDQRLIEVCEVHRLRTPTDLLALVNCLLPSPFHSGDLAKELDIDRGFARQIAYCFRNMGAARQVGKQGNTLLYELVTARDAA